MFHDSTVRWVTAFFRVQMEIRSTIVSLWASTHLTDLNSTFIGKPMMEPRWNVSLSPHSETAGKSIDQFSSITLIIVMWYGARLEFRFQTGGTQNVQVKCDLAWMCCLSSTVGEQISKRILAREAHFWRGAGVGGEEDDE